MNRISKILSLILVLNLFLAGCGKSEKQIAEEKAIEEAISALRKVSAATEVGVNYQQYGSLAIDAKAKVNDANAKITDDKKKQLLNEAMNAYADAAKFWGDKIQNRLSYVSGNLSDGKTVQSAQSKYNFEFKKYTGEEFVDSDKAMQQCWLYASINLAALEELQKQNK